MVYVVLQLQAGLIRSVNEFSSVEICLLKAG